MTTWNKLEEVTAKCLLTFFQTESDFEIIVVDNASTDGTAEWLFKQQAKHPNEPLRVVALQENLGYAGGLNVGLEIAQGEKVVCMNNDIICLHPLWLDVLFKPLDENPRRLIGCRLICDNGMTDVGAGPVPYLEGWMVAAHRDFWEEMGGWDSELSPIAWFEDVDLSWRAVQAGYELYENRNVPVMHMFGYTAYRSGLDFHAITRKSKARFSKKFWEAYD